MSEDAVARIVESSSGWDGEPCGTLTLYDAKFAVDFGPFKKGDVATVTFYFEQSTLAEYNDDGTVKRECKFDVVPRNENSQLPVA